jgi:hypothetical protein
MIKSLEKSKKELQLQSEITEHKQSEKKRKQGSRQRGLRSKTSRQKLCENPLNISKKTFSVCGMLVSIF